MNPTHPPAKHCLVTGLILCCGLLSACADSDTAAPPPAPAVFALQTPPSDFAVAVTVYARPGASRRAVLPPEKRPARYVLAPDWILRWQTGPDVSEQTYPSQTFRLTQHQVTEVWRELCKSGLTDANHRAIVGQVPDAPDVALDDASDATFIPPVYAVSFTAGEVRRTLALQGGDEAAAVPLVRALAAAARMTR